MHLHLVVADNLDLPSAPAVVFDLGKVLLDFDFSIAARTLSPLSKLGPAEFTRVLDQSPLLHQFESGRLTNREFYKAIQRESGYQADFETFAAAFGDIFAEITTMTAWQQELRTRGIPTYIFSNTNDLAIGHIRQRFPFFKTFAGYVLSHEIRAMKPLPASYEAVERLTAKRGPELIYLDDRPENIEGARLRGWQTVLHHDPSLSIRTVNRALGLERV